MTAAVFQLKYPSTSSVALTLTLASLASDSGLIVGRASTAVDNTSNLDLDHFVAGKIRAGTSPTVSKTIEVWAYAAWKMASGTPTYPDSITGTDAAKTLTSLNVGATALRRIEVITVDNTTDRDYYFGPTSIANLYGSMPPWWGVFVVHDTAVNLNSTGGNHEIVYFRHQRTVT